MRALEIEHPGEGGRLVLRDLPIPIPQPGEMLIRTAYAGINQADLQQVAGRYPLSEETGAIPGLEISGHIESLGEGVTGFTLGDPVCALLRGAGYAEFVAVPAGQVLPLPGNIGLKEAAALPEALATVWMALIRLGELKAGESVLIEGGASGIGTATIQIALLKNARVFATARTPEKQAICEKLGATVLEATPESLAQRVKAANDGNGVDVILDLFGGLFAAQHFEAAAYGGRIVTIALMAGNEATLPLGKLLMKNLTWRAMTLRSRPAHEKAALLQEIQTAIWPWIESGSYHPMIDRVFRLEHGEKAHEFMRERLHIGKILLEVSP